MPRNQKKRKLDHRQETLSLYVVFYFAQFESRKLMPRNQKERKLDHCQETLSLYVVFYSDRLKNMEMTSSSEKSMPKKNMKDPL